MPKLIFCLGL